MNGTHPLLPWLAFFCAGIVIGRRLDEAWWRSTVAGVGMIMVALAIVADTVGDSPRARLLLSDDPLDRGVVYTASALGTALVAFAAISWWADRWEATWVVDALRRAGQLSLTIYLAHVLVFNLLVDWFDVVRPGGLATSLGFAGVFWLLATAGAVAYERRYGRGPAERVYRRLTA